MYQLAKEQDSSRASSDQVLVLGLGQTLLVWKELALCRFVEVNGGDCDLP